MLLGFVDTSGSRGWWRGLGCGALVATGVVVDMRERQGGWGATGVASGGGIPGGLHPWVSAAPPSPFCRYLPGCGTGVAAGAGIDVRGRPTYWSAAGVAGFPVPVCGDVVLHLPAPQGPPHTGTMNTPW